MASDEVDYLTHARASDVLASSERDSVGVVRILSDDAGTPGAEREYKSGDEVLVERGQARMGGGARTPAQRRSPPGRTRRGGSDPR
jgi:hypothetical protein